MTIHQPTTEAFQQSQSKHRRANDGVAATQVLLAAALLAIWETAGRYLNSSWISRPSKVAEQIWTWIQGDLLTHIAVTGSEMLIGLSIGISLGVISGILLGRSGLLAIVMRPIVVTLYSVPMVSLAPLFIMFFGVDMMPKIVLVSIVVFFLIFFNTFAGVSKVDNDLVAVIELMGASPREQFQKIIFPSCMSWIMAGIKIALPYALVAAVTGEMIASRQGLGSIITRAASRFDMTALYAVLLILMVMGLLVSEFASRLEKWVLRWRGADE